MRDLLPHEQRVVEERYALNEKIMKLAEFVGGPAVKKVSVNDFVLLRMQLDVMERYSEILGQRIADFGAGA